MARVLIFLLSWEMIFRYSDAVALVTRLAIRQRIRNTMRRRRRKVQTALVFSDDPDQGKSKLAEEFFLVSWLHRPDVQDNRQILPVANPRIGDLFDALHEFGLLDVSRSAFILIELVSFGSVQALADRGTTSPRRGGAAWWGLIGSPHP